MVNWRATDVLGRDFGWLAVLYWATVVIVVVRRRFNPRRKDVMWVRFGLPSIVIPGLAVEICVRWVMKMPF
jgi:predicted transcriptional regulator